MEAIANTSADSRLLRRSHSKAPNVIKTKINKSMFARSIASQVGGAIALAETLKSKKPRLEGPMTRKQIIAKARMKSPIISIATSSVRDTSSLRRAKLCAQKDG